MVSITASPNAVVIDNTATPPQTSAPTTISYQKELDDEVWQRPPGTGWERVDVPTLTGRGRDAEFDGAFSISLRPAECYAAGIFAPDHGPLNGDPIPQASLSVCGVLKRPGVRSLITDENAATGGTWHRHQLATNVTTTLVLIGASRTPPTIDADGIPHPGKTDGGPRDPLTPSNNHVVELVPLLPGHHYFFTAMVMDGAGNWEVWRREFDTLRRKLTVQFPTVHIFNDGDPSGHGEAEFWFQIVQGPTPISGAKLVQQFHLPTQDIDDWSETDRPYAVGFAHVGVPEVVQPGQERVWVSSWGTEYDGWTEADEGAGSVVGRELGLPAGEGAETVTNAAFQLNCPPSTTGDDFHYGVDVVFSVEYIP